MTNMNPNTGVSSATLLTHHRRQTRVQRDTTLRLSLFRFWTPGRLIWGGAILASLSNFNAQSGTITAANPSRVAVGAALALAAHGDTVVIPAGQATWTQGLTITTGVSLIGAGIGLTIINDDLVNDDGVILLETSAGRSYRVSGIEFRAGSRTARHRAGIMKLNGSSSSVRVDHCRFNRMRNISVRLGGYVRGVIDHNEFIDQHDNQQIQIWHSEWANGTWGDKSWSEPINWGGPEAIYIEDNSFVGEGGGPATVTDTYGGARFVFRHNQLSNANLASHGTGDGAGRNRGLRHWEIYNNTWNTDPSSSKNAIHIRGGTGVAFGNVCNGHSKFLTLHTYRFYTDHGKFERADGVSLWDKNDPAGIYLSGTAGAGSGDRLLVVPGANWPVDRWKGYTVRVPNSSQHSEGRFQTIVISNTKDTMTVDKGTQVIEKPFVPGEYFEVRRVLLPLDGTGAGTTELLLDQSADPVPVNLNQVIDPVYVWNNQVNGQPVGAIGDTAILEGVHFINGTPRPGYTPYTYPHPLVSNVPQSTSLAAPASFRVVGVTN